MSQLSTILLRKGFILIPESSEGSTPHDVVATFLKNLSAFGFTLHKESIEDLINTSPAISVPIMEETLSKAPKLVGANVNHKPMYPNFPIQVMEASASELYLNAIMHYLGASIGLRILPVYTKEDRPELDWKTDLRLLDTCGSTDTIEKLTSIIKSAYPYTPQDREDIHYIMTSSLISPEDLSEIDFPVKENLAYISKFFYDSKIPLKVKTATDILRVAVSFTDIEADVSLADESTSFRGFKRPLRRFILNLLESLNSDRETLLEDMLRHRSLWLRLGEGLHPSEPRMAIKYPVSNSLFDILRNNHKSVKSFDSRVDETFKSNKQEDLLVLLQSRPGVFARSLNQVLTEFPSLMSVESFLNIANKVPTRILLDLMEFFNGRDNPETTADLRVFFPKGRTSKAFTKKSDLDQISEDLLSPLMDGIETTLLERFKILPKLGKVYIDPVLSKFRMPSGTRSASKSLNPLERGSRIHLKDETNVIRLFLYWKQSKGTVDLDLSGIMLKDDLSPLSQISYTNLREGNYSCHSGDLTSAPKGASEFIDLDIEKFISDGGRYLIMNVYSFSNQPFCDLPECFAGWMERSAMKSGEIYEPKTVQNRFDLTSKGKVSVPLLIDCVDRQVVWLDVDLQNGLSTGTLNSVEGKATGIVAMVLGMLQMKKGYLGYFFGLQALARGERVYVPEEADTVYDLSNRAVTQEDLVL